MKKLFTILFISLLSVTNVYSQSIFGQYEQSSLVAPEEYQESENNVIIEKATDASKKIWITNLIPNQKIFAILQTKGDGNFVYSVPKQLAGNYQINTGCVIYDEYDGEEELVISLNNEINCLGVKQKDVNINKEGVKVGEIAIGSNGVVNIDGIINIKEGEIQINSGKAMSGILYVGQKQTSEE